MSLSFSIFVSSLYCIILWFISLWLRHMRVMFNSTPVSVTNMLRKPELKLCLSYNYIIILFCCNNPAINFYKSEAVSLNRNKNTNVWTSHSLVNWNLFTHGGREFTAHYDSRCTRCTCMNCTIWNWELGHYIIIQTASWIGEGHQFMRHYAQPS